MFPDLRSFLPSVLRTFTPLLVGYFTSWPVVTWLGLDDDHVTALAGFVIAGLYWLVVRVVETYVYPNAGWLLLYAGRPVYPLPADAGATAGPKGDVVRVVKRSLP